MTDAPPALPPPTVPGLSGLSVVARGGYATVYRATQESVSREVAVKIENRTLESERDRRRFLREARAAGRMSSHPHVVDLFDAGVTPGGHPYLIMELCDGSYADRMKSAPLSASDTRDVGVKIADALADAHALGVLHRDVKPANILITRFGEPALADFGLAILAEVRDTSVTLDVLTPAYAPPELFRHRPPSEAVDVYALCATLYALMQGRPPRWREDRNPSLATLLELFGEPVSDLPGVPPSLIEVLRAGMANDPLRRPAAGEVRDRLDALSLGPGRPVLLHAPDRAAAPGREAALDRSAAPGPVGPGTPARSIGRASPVPLPPLPPTRGPAPTGAAGAAPAPGSSGADTATVASGRSWRLLAALAAGALAMVVAISAGVWYAVTHTAGGPVPGGSPAAGRATSSPVAACVLSAFNPEWSCPSRAECFDALSVSGGALRAAQRPCDQAHTWETFALGTLPASIDGLAPGTVRAAPAVRALCSQVNLFVVDPNAVDLRVDVLPPAPEEFSAGNRTFRCLAGKPPEQLTRPTLQIRR